MAAALPSASALSAAFAPSPTGGSSGGCGIAWLAPGTAEETILPADQLTDSRRSASHTSANEVFGKDRSAGRMKRGRAGGAGPPCDWACRRPSATTFPATVLGRLSSITSFPWAIRLAPGPLTGASGSNPVAVRCRDPTRDATLRATHSPRALRLLVSYQRSIKNQRVSGSFSEGATKIGLVQALWPSTCTTRRP